MANNANQVITQKRKRNDPKTALLTTSQVAEILGISARMVRGLVARGNLSCKKFNNKNIGRWFYDRAEVEAYREASCLKDKTPTEIPIRERPMLDYSGKRVELSVLESEIGFILAKLVNRYRANLTTWRSEADRELYQSDLADIERITSDYEAKFAMAECLNTTIKGANNEEVRLFGMTAILSFFREHFRELTSAQERTENPPLPAGKEEGA